MLVAIGTLNIMFSTLVFPCFVFCLLDLTSSQLPSYGSSSSVGGGVSSSRGNTGGGSRQGIGGFNRGTGGSVQGSRGGGGYFVLREKFQYSYQ